MPISAHLHRKFQETLGADAADEIVNIIESMDAIRGDIGELRHEMRLGFARIDARFEQMDARIDARFEQMHARFDGRLEQMDARFDGRLEQMDARFDGRLEQMDGRFEQMDARFETRLAKMETLLERSLREQTRFFFLAWSVLLAAMMGLYAR